MCAYPVVIAACLCLSAGTVSDPPTAAALLDKYAQALDSLRSIAHLMGYNLASDERIDSILRRAKNVIVRGKALSHLAGLKRLERLSLGGEGVTDGGLAHVAVLSNLNSLTVGGHFTDRALEHLQKLENLGFLDLQGAVLSQDAQSRFRRSMPGLGTFRGYEIDHALRPSPPPRRGR